MKVGAENRTKLFVALGLMLVAVVVLLFNLGSSSPKAATVAPPLTPPIPTSRPVAAATGKAHGKKVSPATRSLDPTLRYDWLKASEDTMYEGTGRNIFMTQAEIPQPIAPATDSDEAKEAAKRPASTTATAAHQPEIFRVRQQAGRSQKDFSVGG